MGSGTGFFTDDMAEKVGKVYGIDFQEDMHQYYRQKGMPENVDFITSKASNIEIKDPDKVFSIPSLYETDLEKTLQKLSDALKEYGKISSPIGVKMQRQKTSLQEISFKPQKKPRRKSLNISNLINHLKDLIPSSLRLPTVKEMSRLP